MSRTQVLFFGQLTDLTGSTLIELPAVNNTAELLQQLFERYPSLQQASFVVTVNRKIVKQSTPLDAQSEVALLPPFSGG